MTSRLVMLPRRGPMLATSLGLGALFGVQGGPSIFRQPRLRCDFSGDSPRQAPSPNIKQQLTTPARNHGQALRQITSGSIVGLVGGLAVSTFSKPLALLIGLLVLGVQALESRGVHVVPYGRLRRLWNNSSVTGAFRSNVPFKISLGVTFLLAGFGSFSAADF